ncbi:MAG: TraR/DksA C4-type zinc finger protein [Pirellulaceae bacterium]|nr:TraR/DksA C4-type zinc finger protein [Pirellulaceae bacterium]
MDARTEIECACVHCDWSERAGASQLAARLRGVGLLKRDDERDPAVLLELARAARTRLVCPDCGSAGLAVSPCERDEWETPAKACAACGWAIPPERVELFPDADLCAACQKQVDSGDGPNAHDDFCPHCGERMVVRQQRGSGLSRYRQVCPACRR